MPYQGSGYSISGFTMTDMGKISSHDTTFLSQLGFPSYAGGFMQESPEPMIHQAQVQTPVQAARMQRLSGRRGSRTLLGRTAQRTWPALSIIIRHLLQFSLVWTQGHGGRMAKVRVI